MTPASDARRNVRTAEALFWLAALVTLPLLIYGASASQAAFDVDDDKHIARLFQAPWNPFADDDPYGYFRPLMRLTFSLDYHTWGVSAAGFAWTNLAIHVLNGVLLSMAALRLFGDARVAAVAGLLFEAHPMLGDAVTWISDRGDLLAATFALATLIAYARYRERRSAWGLALCCTFVLLALFAKEAAIPLPLALVFLDRAAPGRRPPPWSTTVRMAAALAATAAVYFVIRRSASGDRIAVYGFGPLTWQLRTFPVLLIREATRLVAPFELPDRNLLRRFATIAVFAIVAACVAAGYGRSDTLRRVLVPAVGWLVIFLVPVAAMPLGFALAHNRFLYLPAILPCMLIAAVALAARPSIALAWILAFCLLADPHRDVRLSRAARLHSIDRQLRELALPPRTTVFVFADDVAPPHAAGHDPRAERALFYLDLQALKYPFSGNDVVFNPDLHGRRTFEGFRTFLWKDDSHLVEAPNPGQIGASQQLPTWPGLVGWTTETIGAERRIVSPPLSLSSVANSGIALRVRKARPWSATEKIGLALRRWTFGTSPTGDVWRLHWLTRADAADAARTETFAVPLDPEAASSREIFFCLADSYEWFASGVITRLTVDLPPELATTAVESARILPRGDPCGGEIS